jgi:hypothetical protein
MENIKLIAERAKKVISKLGKMPDEIWVAVGSGTLVQGILMAVEGTKTKVFGVKVGKDFQMKHPNLTLIDYPLPFESSSKFIADFPSMPNYDLKAYEMCVMHNSKQKDKNVLFWNVL